MSPVAAVSPAPSFSPPPGRREVLRHLIKLNEPVNPRTEYKPGEPVDPRNEYKPGEPVNPRNEYKPGELVDPRYAYEYKPNRSLDSLGECDVSSDRSKNSCVDDSSDDLAQFGDLADFPSDDDLADTDFLPAIDQLDYASSQHSSDSSDVFTSEFSSEKNYDSDNPYDEESPSNQKTSVWTSTNRKATPINCKIYATSSGTIPVPFARKTTTKLFVHLTHRPQDSKSSLIGDNTHDHISND